MMTGDDLLRVDLNLLVLLRILLETQSVTRTAEISGMSQPAVSRSLRKLRMTFDDPLLVKSGSTMRPTLRGADLLVPLQKALGEISGVLADRPAFDPSTSDRVFRIATTDYGATVILPRLAAFMTIEAPKTSIEITPVEGQTFRKLGEVDTDIALYSDNPVPPSLMARNLFQERFACVVRSAHPGLAKSDTAGIGLDAYLAFPHALVTVPGGRTGTGPVDKALDAIGRSRHIAVRIPYFATAALLTVNSDMILTIPRRAAEMFAGDDRLQIVEPPLKLPEFGYRMIWHERAHSEPDHAWLRQLVLRAVSSERS